MRTLAITTISLLLAAPAWAEETPNPTAAAPAPAATPAPPAAAPAAETPAPAPAPAAVETPAPNEDGPAPEATQSGELRLLKPAARQGFYVGGGLRNGGMSATADDVGGLGFMTGFGFAVRGGQMANDWIGFGLAINSGGGGNDVWGTGYGALSLEVMLTPLKGEDFAVRGSVGVGGMGVARTKEEEKTEKDPSGTAGALYTLGVSYDLFPWYEKDKYESGGFAFTGFLEGMLLPGDGLIAGGVMIGLEVTYWFGFNKNKLDIPPEAY